MHDRARQCTIGSRFDQNRKIGVLHGAVHIDIHRHDLRAAFFACAHGVGHHIDLSIDRIGTPDDDQIGFGHFPRVDTRNAADPSRKAGVGGIDANR